VVFQDLIQGDQDRVWAQVDLAGGWFHGRGADCGALPGNSSCSASAAPPPAKTGPRRTAGPIKRFTARPGTPSISWRPGWETSRRRWLSLAILWAAGSCPTTSGTPRVIMTSGGRPTHPPTSKSLALPPISFLPDATYRCSWGARPDSGDPATQRPLQLDQLLGPGWHTWVAPRALKRFLQPNGPRRRASDPWRAKLNSLESYRILEVREFPQAGGRADQ